MQGLAVPGVIWGYIGICGGSVVVSVVVLSEAKDP